MHLNSNYKDCDFESGDKENDCDRLCDDYDLNSTLQVIYYLHFLLYN